MVAIKNMALSHLQRARLNPIEKIKLCEREDLERYESRKAYIQVCTREESLSAAEFQGLGMDSVLLIMQIRERIIANRRLDKQEMLSEEGIVDDVIGRHPPYSVMPCVDDGTYDTHC
jgi:hypothetical protein